MSRKLVGFVCVGLLFIGCAERPSAKTDPSSRDKQEASTEITGAGATFPYPVYAEWIRGYQKASGQTLNYNPVGSSGGIAQIKARQVDFGASDVPLKPAFLNALGLLQFPTVVGGVVPVVNIDGIASGELKLTRSLLVDIFRGKITNWSDRRIRDVNPALSLPDEQITVVHRADGSGTTWIFTNYLDRISGDWHNEVGTGKEVKWPCGVGKEGNNGVAAHVQKVHGAIGYVEFAYALQQAMTHVLLQNRAGSFVAPTLTSFKQAASNADWENAPGFYLVLTDALGSESWPIAGASFILVRKEQKNEARAKRTLEFFHWAYGHGVEKAEELHYVPMADAVVKSVEALWRSEIRTKENAVVWP